MLCSWASKLKKKKKNCWRVPLLANVVALTEHQITFAEFE